MSNFRIMLSLIILLVFLSAVAAASSDANKQQVSLSKVKVKKAKANAKKKVKGGGNVVPAPITISTSIVVYSGFNCDDLFNTEEGLSIANALANAIAEAVLPLVATVEQTDCTDLTRRRLNDGLNLANGAPNNDLTYELTYTNDGTQTVTDVTATLAANTAITLSTVEGVTYVSSSISGTIEVTGSAITINDNAVATPNPSTIVVGNLGPKTYLLGVYVKGLFHDYMSDIVMTLQNPSGVSVDLLNDSGSRDYVDISAITFTDSALVSINEATDAGLYQPQNPLLPLSAAATVAGTWSLFVRDVVADGDGQISSWSLIFADPTHTSRSPTVAPSVSMAPTLPPVTKTFSSSGDTAQEIPSGTFLELMISITPEQMSVDVPEGVYLRVQKVTIHGFTHANPREVYFFLLHNDGMQMHYTDLGYTCDGYTQLINEGFAWSLPSVSNIDFSFLSKDEYLKVPVPSDALYFHDAAITSLEADASYIIKGGVVATSNKLSGEWSLYFQDCATGNIGTVKGFSITFGQMA